VSDRLSDRIEVWPGRAYPLGPAFDGTGTNFALFSEFAESVDLCLFNDAGEEFGEERLIDALRRHRHLPPQGIISAVVDEVRRFSAHEQHDDITLTVAKCR